MRVYLAVALSRPAGNFPGLVIRVLLKWDGSLRTSPRGS